MTDPRPDVRIVDTGSIHIFQPLNERAEAWLYERIEGEGIFQGSALIVEPRFGPDIALGLVQDGFNVETPDGRVATLETLP